VVQKYLVFTLTSNPLALPPSRLRHHQELTISKKENRQTPIILRSRNLQLLLQALDLRIPDIPSVEETQQVQQREVRDQPHVHLAQRLLGVDVAEVDIAAIPLGVVLRFVDEGDVEVDGASAAFTFMRGSRSRSFGLYVVNCVFLVGGSCVFHHVGGDEFFGVSEGLQLTSGIATSARFAKATPPICRWHHAQTCQPRAWDLEFPVRGAGWQQKRGVGDDPGEPRDWWMNPHLQDKREFARHGKRLCFHAGEDSGSVPWGYIGPLLVRFRLESGICLQELPSIALAA
jgi:hypothetical protein